MKWYRGVIAQVIARQENGPTYDGYESTHLDRANAIVVALAGAGFSIVAAEMPGPVPDDKHGAYIRGLNDAVAIITAEVRNVVRAVEADAPNTSPPASGLKAARADSADENGGNV